MTKNEAKLKHRGSALALITFFLSADFSIAENRPLPDNPAHYVCSSILRRTISPSDSAFIRNDPNGSYRDLKEINDLVLMSFNLLNLYMHVGKYDSEGQEIEGEEARPKDPKFLEWIARIIHDESVDGLLGQEIEDDRDRLILEQFSREYLNDEYHVVEFPGNDPRGIRIGYLIKKDLPLNMRLESYHEQTWIDDGREKQLFSRDAGVISFRPIGDEDPNSPPLFETMVIHNKSMRDRDGDKESRKKARAQFQRIAEIADGREKMIVAGDANRNLFTKEGRHVAKPVFDIGYIDHLEHLGDRDATHYYFPKNGRRVKSRLDTFFNQPWWIKNGLIEITRVHHYTDEEGNELPEPKTKDERKKFPSDHRPVIQVLNFRELLQLHQAELSRRP